MLSKDVSDRLRREGQDAYRRGEPVESCPYLAFEAVLAWENGYVAAELADADSNLSRIVFPWHNNQVGA